MICSIWNGGTRSQSGSGYGIKIKELDRDRYFPKEWNSVFLTLEGENGEVEVNINKPSFRCGNCRELISKEIGLWLIKNGKADWPKGNPPQVLLEPSGERHLTVTFV